MPLLPKTGIEKEEVERFLSMIRGRCSSVASPVRPATLVVASWLLFGFGCASETMSPASSQVDALTVATDARAGGDVWADEGSLTGEAGTGAGACHDLANTAAGVTATVAAAVDYGYKGGALVDGVYVLVAARQYPQAASASYRRTIRVRDGGSSVDWASDDDMSAQIRVTTSAVAHGADIAFEATCGEADFRLYRHYTAGTDTVTLYSSDDSSGMQYVWQYQRR
jgi:hypothetical protein